MDLRKYRVLKRGGLWVLKNMQGFQHAGKLLFSRILGLSCLLASVFHEFLMLCRQHGVYPFGCFPFVRHG